MDRFRLGVDVGGTFTDATLIEDRTGDIRIAKVLTTPADPSQGFSAAVDRIIADNEVTPGDIGMLVHATTVATNAIIEGKIAKTALITTHGFRDMLEIARQIRPSLYDTQFNKPPPLVPRELCFGIPERLDAQGEVLVPIDEEGVRNAARLLHDEGVEAIAVCFLHAYVNPVHELVAGAILRETCPNAMVSLSSHVAPEFREYFRASTTVINAAIRPIVDRYLNNIRSRVDASGVTSDVLVMQSSGGVYSARVAREFPVFMVESGPAAGVIAASFFGDVVGSRNVISFDMGGTTAKAGLVLDGEPRVTKDYEVGSAAMPGHGSQRGSGYPVRTPVIDLVEIGAGGGSIAWVDSGGVLRVGPHSAGADPGPACYGSAGTQPTVTDANLVLGRLNPDYFLGGEMALDVDRARAVIDEHCARPLGLELVEAANGIVEIANSAMVNALRLVSVQRGFDPREFMLVSFGGAGPLHANRLAMEMGVASTLIPISPGIASSLGLLVTDIRREYSTTFVQRADGVDVAATEEAFVSMSAQASSDLLAEGVAVESSTLVRHIDARYIGQSHELTLSTDSASFGEPEVERLVTQFHGEHERLYGFTAPDDPVEFVSLRLTAVGEIPKPTLKRLPSANGDVAAAVKGRRHVYFGEAGGYVDAPVYDRYALGAGSVTPGPAIVEEFDSATVIHPGFTGTVDAFGNILIKPEQED
jgi:N-methylhydantoinase A